MIHLCFFPDFSIPLLASGGNAGAAAGGVIGALVGLAAVAALVVVIRKRRQANLNDALSRVRA